MNETCIEYVVMMDDEDAEPYVVCDKDMAVEMMHEFNENRLPDDELYRWSYIRIVKSIAGNEYLLGIIYDQACNNVNTA